MALFVNADADIDRPADLAGRTVGEFALWGHDPGVWRKGILADEYGLTADRMRWVIGGTDHPIPSFDWIPQPVPDGIEGDTFLRYHHEQGLSTRLLTSDDIFVPELLGTRALRRWRAT